MSRFALGLLVGLILGGAGLWYYLNPSPAVARIDAIQQEAESATQRAKGATEHAVEELRAKLETYDLTAHDIRDELSQTGRIVRRSVKEIGNRLKETATDARITASIKAQFIKDPELSAWDISVSTTNRKVTLSGAVDSPELVGKAMVYALQTAGVDMVISTLQIETEPVSTTRHRETPG